MRAKPSDGTQMYKTPHPPVWRVRGFLLCGRGAAFAP